MKHLLFILCIAEILLVTFLGNFAGPFISPVIFFSVSICIAILFFKISNQPHAEQEPILHPQKLLFGVKATQVILFCGLSIIILLLLRKIWATYIPSMNDAGWSDVIPQIMYLVKRFNSGSQPYLPIQFGNNMLFPTYLPFQWLPYLFAEWFNKDYRWVPAIVLWLSALYFFIKNISLTKTSDQMLLKIIAPVWPLIVWLTLIKYDQGTFIVTVEELVAGYYLFTAASIRDKKVFPLALGIALCLLSRYSIVFWVPMCILCYYISGRKKQAYLILLTISTCFIIFYWIPFLRMDPAIFIKGYEYHNRAALYDWGFGNFLSNGLGFASFAIQYLPGNTHSKLHTYQLIHLSLSVISITACTFFYKRNIAKYSLSSFLLFSLKVYITVFYAFIQTPYNYLFIVPLVISSSLLVSALHKSQDIPFKHAT